jgi:methylthioribose-1-phosphate isomerase
MAGTLCGGTDKLGVALAVGDEPRRRDRDVAALRAARPTAVNLARGVDHALALALLESDAARNRALGAAARTG